MRYLPPRPSGLILLISAGLATSLLSRRAGLVGSAGPLSRRALIKVGDRVVHTGQLFFADSLTDTVYKTGVYKARPARDTRNSADAIYRSGGAQGLLAMKRTATGGYVGTITLGVRHS